MDPDLIARYVNALRTVNPNTSVADPRDAAGFLGRFLAPGISDYLTKQPPAPATVPNAAGKLPSSNPYEAPALRDLTNIAAGVAGGGVAGEAAPALGAVGRAIGASVDPLDATILGAAPTAVGATPAEAATLGPRAQQKLEMQKQQMLLQQQNEEAKARLQLQTQQQQHDQAAAQAAADAKAAHDAQIAAQNAPFRDKYPGLTASLPLIGMGIAGGVPYASRIKAVLSNNRLAGMMENSVARAGEALANNPTRAQLAGIQQEMKAGLNQAPLSTHNSIGGSLASALVGADVASMTPTEYDATMLPPGDPNREAARQTLYNPMEWLSRMGPAVAGAGSVAKLGGFAPVLAPERLMPTAQMEGIMKRVMQAKKRSVQ